MKMVKEKLRKRDRALNAVKSGAKRTRKVFQKVQPVLNKVKPIINPFCTSPYIYKYMMRYNSLLKIIRNNQVLVPG